MGKAEWKVESYLDQEVKKRGGFTRKFAYIGRRGGADRIVFMFGVIVLIEVKTKTGKESKLQQLERERIVKAGCEAYVLFGKSDIDMLMEILEAKYGANGFWS